MTREAGPPVARADPDPTKRPVPKSTALAIFRGLVSCMFSSITNRAANCDHLQMSSFQTHRKRRLSRRLVRKGFPFRICELGDHASIGIPLEAVDEATKFCSLFRHNDRAKVL